MVNIYHDCNGYTPQEAKAIEGYIPYLYDKIQLIPKTGNILRHHYAVKSKFRAEFETTPFSWAWQVAFDKHGYKMEKSFKFIDKVYRFDNYGNKKWIEIVDTCYGSLTDKSLIFSMTGCWDNMIVILNGERKHCVYELAKRKIPFIVYDFNSSENDLRGMDWLKIIEQDAIKNYNRQ